MRSVLTMLGIIIGVAAVIAMVSIGQGADAAVQKQIESLGTNLLDGRARVRPPRRAFVRAGAACRRSRFNDAAAIKRECPAVDAVTYFRRQVVQVVYGNKNWSTVGSGHHPVVLRRCANWTASAGSFFTERDDATANRVVVLGQTVVDAALRRQARIRSARRSASRTCPSASSACSRPRGRSG